MRSISKDEFIATISNRNCRCDYSLFKYKICNSWFLSVIYFPKFALDCIEGDHTSRYYLIERCPVNMKTKVITKHESLFTIGDFCEMTSEIKYGTREDLDQWTKYYIKYIQNSFGALADFYLSDDSGVDFLKNIRYYAESE